MKHDDFFNGIEVGNGFGLHNPKDWYDDNCIMVSRDTENLYSLISRDEKNEGENLTRAEVENHETSFGCTVGELIDGLKNMINEFGPGGNGKEFKVVSNN